MGAYLRTIQRCAPLVVAYKLFPNMLFDGNADTAYYGQMPSVTQYRSDISLGMSEKQDPNVDSGRR